MSDETIFAAALEKADPAERTVFLDRACPDPAARERIDRLLAAHDQAGAFMQRPAVAPEGFPTVTQAPDGDGGAEPDDALAFLTPSARPDALGRIGHYDVLQVLGKGAFGIVFRAFDDVLQRVVAVKVMAPLLAATSPARKRFLREARSSAQVRHENVVQVYDVGEQPMPFIVMEFIPGETLQQRLSRVGPVDAAEVVRVGRQIAEGLAAAHASDLIHRDIKPGNVLIEGGQHRVKITDFGLARAADDASISQSGIIAGTPMYMAPEQALGQKLDQRADLFSLGSVLYQMAAGRPPFRATGTVAVLKRVAEDTPRDIREITPETPAWLCDIIARLHAKNPDDRYQSAREVADVLADCEAQLKANNKLKDYSRIPRGAPRPAWRPRRRAGLWVAALALLVPVALVAVAFGLPSWQRWQAGVEARPAYVTVRPGSPAVAFRFDAGRIETGVTQHQQPVAPGEHSVWFRLGDREFRTAPFALRPGERVVLELAVSASGGTAMLDGRPLAVTAAPPPAPSADGWVQLFNGRDLSGWIAKAGEEPRWKVEGGELVGFGPADTFLYTGRADYRDFHLRVEARAESHADSGVLVRCQLGGPFTGHEVTILGGSHPEWNTGSIWGEGGANVKTGLAGAGEWFTLEVVARGGRIVTKVNGKPAADWFDPERAVTPGHLALQYSENAPGVRFRKVEIKELTAGATPPAFTNGVGMEFVVVPKGKAWLGGGKDRLGDKEVDIPADFYLGKYEVTQEEWVKVMGENPSQFSRTGAGTDSVKGVEDAELKRFPVESVSWDQCQLFVAKLNRSEKEPGWVYRLPTGAEWEYACRGGPTADRLDSAFDFYLTKPTNTLLPRHANFNKGLGRSCKVGLFEANRLGLFDMHGNLWEWCDDTEKAADGVSHRVSRGGCWNNDSVSCGAANRAAAPPSARNDALGLRLARVPAGAPSPAPKADPNGWTVLKPAEMKSEGGATLKLQADDSVLVSGTHPDKDRYTLTIRDLPVKVHSLRLEVLPHPSLPMNGPGRHADLPFVLTAIKAELVTAGKTDPPGALKLVQAWADHSTGDDATPTLAIDADDNTGWCAEFDKWHYLVVELAEPVAVPAGASLRVTLEFKHDDVQRSLGCFRLSAAPVVQPRPEK